MRSYYFETPHGSVVQTECLEAWNSDPEAKRLTVKAGTARLKTEATARLVDLLNKGDHKIKCILRHESRSGMSRRIDFYTIIDGDMVYLTQSIAWALEMSMDTHSHGLSVGGCGMDMGFHVVNNLSMALYCPDKYDHDAAYKLKSDWI